MRKKIFAGLVILLMLAFASIFAFAYMDECKETDMKNCPKGLTKTDCFLMGRKECAHYYLKNSVELGLSEDQIEKLKKIDKECKTVRIRHKADEDIAKIELQSLLDSNSPDSTVIEKMVEEIGKHQIEMDKSCVAASLKARAVLTEEQYKRTKNLEDSMCKMRLNKEKCDKMDRHMDMMDFVED